MGMASHFKTIAYTDASPVFSRSLRRRDAWTNGDMHAIRRLPPQLFEGVGACTFLHSNRLSSCCRRGKYPHSTEPVPKKERSLAIRLGIHTGLVVVGAMGGQGRQEQLALGETPNIAARIQGLAAPNRLVTSEAT